MNTMQLEARPAAIGTKQPSAQSLIDCHAAEHLLIGTHDRNGTSEPVCLTCQLDLPLSA